MQRADAFGQEDRVPVGQGGVRQVAGWASAAPVESDVGGRAAHGRRRGRLARGADWRALPCSRR